MLTRFVCVLLIGLMASVPSWAELSPANLLSDELNSLPSGAPELQVIFTVAFSSELGVPLSKVKEKHPGHPWNTFSPNLLKVLQDREWLYSGLLLALDDRRVTKSKSAYLFENKAMSVADLAASILGYLLPTRDDEASATKLEDLKRNSTAEVFEAATVALLRQKTEQWLAETKGLGAEARAKLWLSKAHGVAHSKAVAAMIFFDDERFFPGLESDLLGRAKAPDDPTLILEVAAYLRQRRQLAAPFWQKFIDSAHKDILKGDFDIIWLREGKQSMLVEADSLLRSIEGFEQGKQTLDKAGRIVERSVDQPWAYHSLGIEPASMHVPIAWRNIQIIVEAAARQKPGPRRNELMGLAVGASGLLDSVWGNADKAHLPPSPTTWLDSRLANYRKHLLAFIDEEIADEAVMAAVNLTVQYTTTMVPKYQRELLDMHYRLESSGAVASATAMARDLLESKLDILPALLSPPKGPWLDAFSGGSAEKWNNQLQALPWYQQIQFPTAIASEPDFAKKLAVRMLQWTAWECEDEAPVGFLEGWKQHCENKSLSIDQIDFFRQLLQKEAEQGRFWEFMCFSRTGVDQLTTSRLGFVMKISKKPAELEAEDKSDQARNPHLFITLATDRDYPQEQKVKGKEEIQFTKNVWIPSNNGGMEDKTPEQSIQSSLHLLEKWVPVNPSAMITLELSTYLLPTSDKKR